MPIKMTRAEYQAKYGVQPDFSTAKPSVDQKQDGGFLKDIGDAFKAGVSKTVEGYKESKKGFSSGSFLKGAEGSIKMGAGVVETAFSPLAPVTKPIGQAIDYTSERISDIPAVQKFATSKAGEVTSRIAGDVANLSTIAGFAMGGAKAPGKISSLAKETSTNIGTATSKLSKSVQERVSPTKSPVETAIKDATPDYETSTTAQRTKLLSRVEEGGILKGRTVKPNKLEIEAGNELLKVPDYDPASTKLQKYQVAEREVAKRGQDLENSLKTEKVIVPKKELASKVVKAINEVPNKSLLLQKSDPVIVNYVRVLKSALKKEPGNLLGVLKLRKLLDSAYENARGKQAFGSDKISALDDVNKVARDVLTDYLIEKAQNTDVKASLRSQWNLYRALDELKISAEKESGSSIGRLRQNYPLTNEAVETGIKAAGLGAGLGIIK